MVCRAVSLLVTFSLVLFSKERAIAIDAVDEHPTLEGLRKTRWPDLSQAAELSKDKFDKDYISKLLSQTKMFRDDRAMKCARRQNCKEEGHEELTAYFTEKGLRKLLEILPIDLQGFIKWAKEEGSNVFVLKLIMLRDVTIGEALDLQAEKPVR